jgi:hypothetical protein
MYPKENYTLRKGIAILSILLIFAGIISLFWRNEWIYSLPTPVPARYKPVDTGSAIDLAGKVKLGNRPVFLHFFNPDCPCSRFNISYFRSLVKQYGKEVDFGIVVMSNKNYTAVEIQDKFGFPLPVSFDTTIAVACGVYSTPQAVIISAGHKLYYRGNYNKSRYCTDRNSNYAQMALEALLKKNSNLVFDRFALTAYGCRLPNCNK